MMTKKETRLKKSTRILSIARWSQWCYVNTENEFTFLGQKLVIDEAVEEYRVRNKAGEAEDYTNEAYMEEILVVLDKEDNLRFYNQNYDVVESKFVLVRE